MRRSSLLLLLLALLLPGCASDPAPADAPAAGSPPPAGSTAPASFEDVRLEHDHTQGGTKEATFTIPAGLGPVRFEAYFRGVQGTDACASAGPDPARIVVKDPLGEVVVDQGPGTSGVGISTGSDRCGGGATREGAVLAPGVWTVTFSGQGAAVGVVSVQRAG